MWAPGTLLQIKRSYDDNFRRVDSRQPVNLAIVISVRQTGYGTKGDKWDALIMRSGELMQLKDAWKIQDHFHIHWKP